MKYFFLIVFLPFTFITKAQDCSNVKAGPTIVCPSDITQNTDPNLCTAKVSLPAPTLEGWGPGVHWTSIPLTNTDFKKGSTTVRYTATDASGTKHSCSMKVIVEDNEKPDIPNYNPYFVDADLNICGTRVDLTVPKVQDNCSLGGLTPISYPYSNSFFQVGETPVIYSVIDGSSNEATSTTFVKVSDKQKPVIKVKGITKTIKYNNSVTISIAEVDNGSSDNCPGTLTKKLARNIFDCNDVGENQVLYTVTDESGNESSMSVTITIGLTYDIEDYEMPDPENPCSILPITLKSFIVNCENGNNQLQWVTLSELNNDYFIIEKSEDAFNWVSIGTLKGAGNSRTEIIYNFTDSNSSDLNNYYRITQFDYDGKFERFPIRQSSCNKTVGNRMIAYPNPASNFLKLDIFSAQNVSNAIIEIISTNGQIVYSEKLKIEKGNLIQNIDLSEIPSGLYLIQLNTVLGDFAPIKVNILK
jgi:hypothetical protein